MSDDTAAAKEVQQPEEIKFGGMLPGDATMDEDITEDSAAEDSQVSWELERAPSAL
jgi:hypothetical protein